MPISHSHIFDLFDISIALNNSFRYSLLDLYKFNKMLVFSFNAIKKVSLLYCPSKLLNPAMLFMVLILFQAWELMVHNSSTKWINDEYLSDEELQILKLFLISSEIPSYLKMENDEKKDDQYNPVSYWEMCASFKTIMREYQLQRFGSLETMQFVGGPHRSFSMDTEPVSSDEDDFE